MIGAISTKRAGIFYHVIPKNNTRAFKNYCHELYAWIRDNAKKVVLVLDNLSIHKNKRTLRYLQSKKVSVYFLPVGSSFLSPVEHCWALLKRSWSIHLGSLSDAQLKRLNFVDEINKVMQDLSE